MRRTERGSVLLLILVIAVVAAGIVASTHISARSAGQNAELLRRKTQARYLAEAGLEAGFCRLARDVANWETIPAGGSYALDGRNADYSYAELGSEETVTDTSGFVRIRRRFRIDSLGVVDEVRHMAHRIAWVETTPIFQFVVFYQDDLEILPGPDMTLKGRIHCNSDIYLGAGKKLFLDTNHLRSAGSFYRFAKRDPTQSTGTVKIRRYVDNPFDASEPERWEEMLRIDQMKAKGVPTDTGFDSTFTAGLDKNGDGDLDDPNDLLPWTPGALELWRQPDGYSGGNGQTVLSAQHGARTATPPEVGSIAIWEEQPGGDFVVDTNGHGTRVSAGTGTHRRGAYHERAGLRILTHPDGTWTATDEGGSDVTAALADAVSIESMYDARQAGGGAGTIRVTQIDVEALRDSGHFPTNGLIYAGTEGATTGTDCGGVRLKRGEELPGPLTVASENPVYVWGDYNTVAPKPAAVIGDAVNLLSNAWDDTKSPANYPRAAHTTFHVAIVTGNQETVGAAYNGGLENLPRFHEDWNGKTATIHGSFVNLWRSRHATGSWVYGGPYYDAPRRDWHFDEAFNVAGNLPPHTPGAVVVRPVVTW